jgi:polysaccharide biosynthesis protein PelC
VSVLRWFAGTVVILALAGCGTTARVEWAKPGATAVATLAVLPFENQTAASHAGSVVSNLMVSELVATGRIGVLDPSEAADRLHRENLDPGDPIRLPSAQRLGHILNVSHVLQGSVTEYRYKPGISETPVVGVTARVVDAVSGDVVWTASHARSGSNVFREDGLALVAQSIIRDMALHLTAALGRGPQQEGR